MEHGHEGSQTKTGDLVRDRKQLMYRFGQVNIHKIASWVQIVFARLVNHAQHAVLLGLFIVQNLIELSDF